MRTEFNKKRIKIFCLLITKKVIISNIDKDIENSDFKETDETNCC